MLYTDLLLHAHVQCTIHMCVWIPVSTFIAIARLVDCGCNEFGHRISAKHSEEAHGVLGQSGRIERASSGHLHSSWTAGGVQAGTRFAFAVSAQSQKQNMYLYACMYDTTLFTLLQQLGLLNLVDSLGPRLYQIYVGIGMQLGYHI